MSKRYYPCDEGGNCPFDAVGGYDCRNYCGLGVDEDESPEIEDEYDGYDGYDYQDLYDDYQGE